MKKLQFSKDTLKVAIMTLITVLTWTAFEIYQVLHKIDVPQVLQEQTAPLNTKLTTGVIEQLKKRNSLNENEVTIIIPEKSEEPEESTNSGNTTAL